MFRLNCLTVLLLALAAVSARADDEKLKAVWKRVEEHAKNEKWDKVEAEFDAALAQVAKDKLIRFDEEIAPLYRGRAKCRELFLKKHKEAITDYREAAKLDPKQPWSCLDAAWLLATSPDEKVRDGKDAVKLALEGQKRLDEYEPSEAESLQLLASGKILEMLFDPPNVLAAAYAEAGDFKKAVRILKEFTDGVKEQPFGALGLAFLGGDEKELKARMERTEKRLELYRNSKPYRMGK